MQRLKLEKDKALAFIVGLVYGYRNSHMELKVLSFDEFSEDLHREDKIYYINKEEGKLCNSMEEGVSHVCVIREEKEKVKVFIYKNIAK
ncbi:MAG: hypothetical protein ACK4VK_06925 [Aquificaceae bacterium]